MHQRLGEYLARTYPDGEWLVQDDGTGPYLKKWDSSDPAPTIEQVEAWVQSEAQRERRAEILGLLNDIDLQSVRPLRAQLAGVATEDDTTKLAALEAQAQTLRVELEGLSQ